MEQSTTAVTAAAPHGQKVALEAESASRGWGPAVPVVHPGTGVGPVVALRFEIANSFAAGPHYRGPFGHTGISFIVTAPPVEQVYLLSLYP